MGFSRKEHWSKSSFLFPGDLPDPGIEPASPAWLADSLPAEPPGKPHNEGGGSRGDQEGTVRGRKKQYCRSQSGPCLKKKKSAAKWLSKLRREKHPWPGSAAVRGSFHVRCYYC